MAASIASRSEIFPSAPRLPSSVAMPKLPVPKPGASAASLEVSTTITPAPRKDGPNSEVDPKVVPAPPLVSWVAVAEIPTMELGVTPLRVRVNDR